MIVLITASFADPFWV